MISRKSTYTPYCRSFSWFYKFILRKWRHFRIPIWRKRTVSVISSHSEEPVAHFNIANHNKSAEEFLPDKKARPDLNLQAIDQKFAQIVAFYIRPTICKIFSSIPLKLRPDRSKMRKHKKNSCYSEGLLRILILRKPYFPPLSILSGWIHIIEQGCASLFYVYCELTL